MVIEVARSRVLYGCSMTKSCSCKVKVERAEEMR
jgi:hypothetical protein